MPIPFAATLFKAQKKKKLLHKLCGSFFCVSRNETL